MPDAKGSIEGVYDDTAMPSLQQTGYGARFGFSDKAIANPCTNVQGSLLQNITAEKNHTYPEHTPHTAKPQSDRLLAPQAPGSTPFPPILEDLCHSLKDLTTAHCLG